MIARSASLGLALLLVACGDLARTPPTDATLEIGETFTSDVRLEEVIAPDEPVRVQDLLGTTATVFYAWSVPCPCVEHVEPRVQKAISVFPPESGVSWIAVAGEPTDTSEQLLEKMLRLDVRYRVLRDPQQELCRRLGFGSATQIAVLDGDGRLVYRGGIDGSYSGGRAEYLLEGLRAVTEGRPPDEPERSRVYGCFFGDPGSCTELAPEPQ